jgi:hypothetical protein
LLHGKFVCELTDDDNVLIRFKEHTPLKPSQSAGFQGLFSAAASKGLITSQTVEILQRIFKQISRQSQFAAGDLSDRNRNEETLRPEPMNHAYNEMTRVLKITDEVGPKSLHHRLLLALLIYIFNFHNQPQVLPPVTAASSCAPVNKIRHPYLKILSKVAEELAQPGDAEDHPKVTEREVTLWTMIAIGSASSFSPWRLEIPFMGHLIEWMEDDDDTYARVKKAEGDWPEAISTLVSKATPSASGVFESSSKPLSNLDKLTACLRGYYLYGADKKTLRGLQTWMSSDAQSFG